jgi:hypothetical protein
MCGRWRLPRVGSEKETLKGSPTVPITALGSWEKHREGDPQGWPKVLITALGSILEKILSPAAIQIQGWIKWDAGTPAWRRMMMMLIIIIII